MPDNIDNPTFSGLLKECLSEPGIISDAYSAFHNYSFGNMMAAAIQLHSRGQKFGPIASFMAWKEKGRSVKKGSKALVLCMPITRKGQKQNDDGSVEDYTFSQFIWKRNWFVLQDTEGEDFAHEVKSPEWDVNKALAELNITQEEFNIGDGNCQGYAYATTIGLNPVGVYPHKTRFHELAHIVLGHTKDGGRIVDGEKLTKDIREVEAESVAFLCCSLLKLPGLDESRGYVQHWLGAADLPEKNAQRIYKAADQILKAGSVGLKKDAE